MERSSSFTPLSLSLQRGSSLEKLFQETKLTQAITGISTAAGSKSLQFSRHEQASLKCTCTLQLPMLCCCSLYFGVVHPAAGVSTQAVELCKDCCSQLQEGGQM